MTPRKSAKTRSSLSNGTTLFLGDVDSRSEVGRRYADIQADLADERGGWSALSVGQREALRTYAGLAIQRDLMHARIARGEHVDPEAMGQLGDRMERQLRRIGPVKAAKPADIRTHIAARRMAGGTA